MLFKKPIQKTKNFFLKALQSLKSYLFGESNKLPRILFLNPLSCSSINQRSHQLDHIYTQLTNQTANPDNHRNNAEHSMKQLGNIIPSKEVDMRNIDAKHKRQELARRKIEPSSSFSSSSRYVKTGAYMLAQKMKELEMMDLNDVDQSLDVEEALHYYSRLTCPVYVDIVNKFFMDMYADFLLPQPSIGTSTSSRRLGPLAL